jgi:hypothetical protein
VPCRGSMRYRYHECSMYGHCVPLPCRPCWGLDEHGVAALTTWVESRLVQLLVAVNACAAGGISRLPADQMCCILNSL